MIDELIVKCHDCGKDTFVPIFDQQNKVYRCVGCMEDFCLGRQHGPLFRKQELSGAAPELGSIYERTTPNLPASDESRDTPSPQREVPKLEGSSGCGVRGQDFETLQRCSQPRRDSRGHAPDCHGR